MQSLPSVETLIAQLAIHGIALPHGPVRVDGYGDSGVHSAALTKVAAISSPPGLEFMYSCRLVVPRGATDAAIDDLFECVRRERMVELTVFPAYSLI
jgi:hypothetical protein